MGSRNHSLFIYRGFHSAGISDIFSDSSNEDMGMRGPPAACGSDAFSNSSVEEKVCAADPHEVFSDSDLSEEGLPAGVPTASSVPVTSSHIHGLDVFSDFSDEGDSGQKVGITGDEVFSDSEIEAEIEAVPAVTSSNSSDDSDYKQTCKCSSFSSETLKNAS